MTCFGAKRKSTAYFDTRLRERERARVEDHLRACDPCAGYYEQIRSVRLGLQRLPRPDAPSLLRIRLQILASRERQILTEPSSSRWERAWEAWKFRVNQWMRPLTIPATGGIVSSILLSIVFALSMVTNTRTVAYAYDVPLDYQQQDESSGTATLLPMNLRSSLLLNMRLDGHGHIQNFMARDSSAQITGHGRDLSSHDISLPNFPEPAVGGDISILVTPVVYLR